MFTCMPKKDQMDRSPKFNLNIHEHTVSVPTEESN